MIFERIKKQTDSEAKTRKGEYQNERDQIVS